MKALPTQSEQYTYLEQRYTIRVIIYTLMYLSCFFFFYVGTLVVLRHDEFVFGIVFGTICFAPLAHRYHQYIVQPSYT